MGGVIALVEDGDIITIDAGNREISVAVSPEDLATRKKKWVAPPLKAKRGTLYKYIKNVSPASQGCVTDE